MGEHIHSLELKLTELEKFPERVRVIDNELMRSDSQCWLLMEEVRCKEEELQKASLQIEKLESTVLDSQCEIESLKLDLTNLEQKQFDAENFVQDAAEHKARMDKLLGERELQLHQAQKTIEQLVLENKDLKELPVKAPKRSPSTSGEQLDKTLEDGGHEKYVSHNVILERMARQNEESELLIEQLKVIGCLLHVLWYKLLILASAILAHICVPIINYIQFAYNELAIYFSASFWNTAFPFSRVN